MNKKFLKRGYGLIAAFVLTILVATPYATQASDEFANQPNVEQVAGDPVDGFCG